MAAGRRGLASGGLVLDPEPDATLADIEHREHAQCQQQTPKIHDVFARRTGHLEHACLDFLELVELQEHRCAVEETVRQGIDRLLQERTALCAVGHHRQLVLIARELPQLPHRTVQDLQQHVGGLLLLGLRHRLFQECRDRGEAARRRVRRRARGAGKQVERAQRAFGKLAAQVGLVISRHRGQRKAARGLAAQRAVLQRGAQAHPVGNAALVVGGDAQVAELLARRFAHAGQEHRLPVHLHGHHIVVVLARLPSAIAQLVLHRGADVAQRLGAVGAGRGTQVLLQRLVQRFARDAARIGLARGIGDVLDIHQPEIAELDRHAFAVRAGAGALQRRIAAHGTVDGKGAARAALHRVADELQARAAILEAGLVDGDAIDDERLVHLDGGLGLLAGDAVGDDHVGGEQLGHAGLVEVDRELLERERERQVLHQRAVGDVQDGRGHGLPLGHVGIAAKTGVGRRQPVLRRDLADHRVAADRGLATQPHLRADQHVAIEQAADADHHDGGMRQDIADLVGGPRLARQQRGAVMVDGLDAVAAVAQQRRQPAGRLGARARAVELAAMVEGAQAALAHMVLPRAHVRNHLGRVAHQAERGGHHQEGQDQQEPPRAVDFLQRQRMEDIGPERPELVDVVRIRLVLLEHGADHAGDGDHGQQRDREAHRGHQFDRVAQHAVRGLQVQP
ncbi:hypothetical protein D3C81_864610 [compost metagenome]